MHAEDLSIALVSDHLLQGDKVWLDNTAGGELEVPIGATVKFSDTGQIQLVDDDDDEHWVSSKNASKIKIMNASSVEGVEDMVRILVLISQASPYLALQPAMQKGKGFTHAGVVSLKVWVLLSTSAQSSYKQCGSDVLWCSAFQEREDPSTDVYLIYFSPNSGSEVVRAGRLFRLPWTTVDTAVCL